jgi:hypothetical protein
VVGRVGDRREQAGALGGQPGRRLGRVREGRVWTVHSVHTQLVRIQLPGGIVDVVEVPREQPPPGLVALGGGLLVAAEPGVLPKQVVQTVPARRGLENEVGIA